MGKKLLEKMNLLQEMKLAHYKALFVVIKYTIFS